MIEMREMAIIAPYRGLERPRRLGGTVMAPGGLTDAAHMSQEAPSALADPSSGMVGSVPINNMKHTPQD